MLRKTHAAALWPSTRRIRAAPVCNRLALLGMRPDYLLLTVMFWTALVANAILALPCSYLDGRFEDDGESGRAATAHNFNFPVAHSSSVNPPPSNPVHPSPPHGFLASLDNGATIAFPKGVNLREEKVKMI